jgi:ABC-type Fe3+-hydroxamate transport system substrate-binding protein
MRKVSSVTISDYIGNSFECKPYTRIISLVPSITELLFDLGLETSIVGVTKYCVSPENAKYPPRVIVGGTKNPDIEIIEKLNPDLVIINKEENRLRHYSQLQDRNILVYVTYPRTVQQAIQMIDDFIQLFAISSNDIKNKSKELHELYDAIQTKTVRDLDRKKVFCAIWKDPWMTINSDTFISSLIEFCGGTNVFAKVPDRYPKVSLEEIIEHFPDVILLPDEPYNFTQKDKEELSSIPQLSNTRIELVDGTFHWYSFRILKTLPMLTTLVRT